MKKKSPPYAIIGAAILGIAAIFFFIQHDRARQAELDAKAAADAAALAAAQAAANQQAPAPAPAAPTHTRPVYYATQPMDPGVKISAAFFEKKDTPEGILPDAYSDATDIVGWYAVRRIEKGDPLTPRNIGKSLPYLSQRISPGMRAVTLPVFMGGDVNDTGGFAVDGDKVDLLYTLSTLDGLKINTQTVMQNVTVLYVPGSPIHSDKTDGVNPQPSAGPVAITFEVSPEQAQALIFMEGLKYAAFSMILRSRKDTEETKLKPFAFSDYDWLNLKKLQKMVDKSDQRVSDLAQQIEAKEKADAQPNTNETPNPTPPSP